MQTLTKSFDLQNCTLKANDAVHGITSKKTEKQKAKSPSTQSSSSSSVTQSFRTPTQVPAVKQETNAGTAGACYNCGSPDHWADKCLHPKQASSSSSSSRSSGMDRKSKKA